MLSKFYISVKGIAHKFTQILQITQLSDMSHSMSTFEIKIDIFILSQ